VERAPGSLAQSVKKLLFRYPGLTNAVYRAMYSFRDGSLVNKGQVSAGEPADVFAGYFERNSWHDAESLSGPGSNLAATEMIRASLPKLLQRLGVRTLLDAPCGDLYWIREVVAAGDFRYIGGDIVPALIAKLDAEIDDPKYSFQVLDIVADPLPKADLWLCRDCFIHLPTDMVCQALRNFYRSGIPYLLTTQFDFPRANAEIEVGDFRAINLRRAPFELPMPREELYDIFFPYPPRKLSLWHRDQMPAALRAAPGA
jgi:hypothetical protein